MRENAHCGPILVTDDDDLLRTYVIDLLEQAGYAAFGAASGQQALELARRERPSLVVLDVLMPDLSGYEVCRQLRALYGPSLPILFVSGERRETADRVAGLLLGADDYLPKPFAADELLARIYSLVRRLLSGGAETRSSLTQRELEVLRLLADGKRIAEVARALVISEKTVQTHVGHIYEKFGVHNRTQALASGYRQGLLELL
jgi:DNA-binding NarL/FixJ family response regulator